jgi:hypothetical protein
LNHTGAFHQKPQGFIFDMALAPCVRIVVTSNWTPKVNFLIFDTIRKNPIQRIGPSLFTTEQCLEFSWLFSLLSASRMLL